MYFSGVQPSCFDYLSLNIFKNLLIIFIYVHVYVCVWICAYENRCPERHWISQKLEFIGGCRCWELNSGPLIQKYLLLPSEPSPQLEPEHFWSLCSEVTFLIAFRGSIYYHLVVIDLSKCSLNGECSIWVTFPFIKGETLFPYQACYVRICYPYVVYIWCGKETLLSISHVLASPLRNFRNVLRS